MRSIEEIKKGLDGYIEYWRKMANSDESGEFRRKNDPVKEYWKGVREALDEPMQERERLKEGFWPASRVEDVQMLKIARAKIPKMQISIIKESVGAFRGGD